MILRLDVLRKDEWFILYKSLRPLNHDKTLLGGREGEQLIGRWKDGMQKRIIVPY